ncbi:MAG: hypothetical protein GQ557_01245 [Mycoplasmataceae bacterium]|nr:hypothetical protein [Mycoplasmataceae bacterium]
MGQFKEEKNLYDVIFLNDEELGILKQSPSRGSRPCVVIEIEEDYAKVATLSSRDSFDHSSYRLSFNSYISLQHIEKFEITIPMLDYAQLDDNKILDNADIVIIEQYYR